MILSTRESRRALKEEPFQDPSPCTASSTGFPPLSFLSVFCELFSSLVSVLNFSNQSSSGTRGSLSGSTWLPLQPRFPDSSPFTSWHRHPLHHGHLLCWNSGSRLPAPRNQLMPPQDGSLWHPRFCKSLSLTWMFSFPV